MRIIRNGDSWELCTLTHKDRQELYVKLRARNRVIMRSCLLDAQKLVGAREAPFSPAATAHIAHALFEKLACGWYTVFQEMETAKVYNYKEAGNAALAAAQGNYRPVEMKEMV